VDKNNGDKLAREFCPSQCLEECGAEPFDPCRDSEEYRFRNNPNQPCSWVFTRNNCDKVDTKNGDKLAREFCPSLCLEECDAE
jgi:hypothetical protein